VRVAILDNDTALLKSLQLVLSSLGHETSCFADPRQACSFLAAGPPPDLLILDYVMPGMNGGEVLEQLDRILEGRRPPVILISGHTDLLDPRELEAMQVDAFLPKPLDLDRLTRLIESPAAAGREREEAETRERG
jgi:twitching motility two-component system response regulator PilH